MSKISPTGDSLRACNAGQHPATASGTNAGATACLYRETSMTAFRFVHFAGAAALALTALFAAPQPAAAQSKKIRIGFVTTLSGPNAAYGKDMKDSVELALDHLGHKLGGIPVEEIGRASSRERVCQLCRSRWLPYP